VRRKAIAIVLGVAAMGVARPQDIAVRPKFEVAAIKRNTRGDPGVRIGVIARSRFDAENVWLRFLIEYAWNVRDFQLSGGPAWAASDRYDVHAAKEASASLAQTRLMLQALLEDRFQLKLHRETKESQVYALVAAKGGIHLPASSCIVAASAPPDPKVANICGGTTTSLHSISGTGMSMAELGTALSNALQRPVIDKTGLAGMFDVHVEWTADQSTPGFVAPGLPPAPQGQADPNAKSIFTAIQEQLGLKLESTKGPVEFLVIDRLERPSEN
jgi:uncharacterized protein (TIGR03435 family)